jgi:hypothetical protein
VDLRRGGDEEGVESLLLVLSLFRIFLQEEEEGGKEGRKSRVLLLLVFFRAG